MVKYLFYILISIITLFLVFSNVIYRDYKCYEDKDAKFVLLGGKHYPCYDNIKEK